MCPIYIFTLQTFYNPCKMSERKRVKSDDSTSSLSTLERKRVFDQVYKGDPLLDAKNNLFKKNSKELAKVSDSKKYTLYFSALIQAENEAEMAKIFAEQSTRDIAEAKVASRVLKEFPKALLKNVFNELGPLLFDIAYKYKELTDEKNTEIATKIQTILIDDTENCTKLLQSLSLGQFVNPIHVTTGQSQIPSHDSFSIKIAAMDTSEEILDAFRFYTEIAKSTDIEESVFKELYTEIFSTTDKFYQKDINPDKIDIYSFCSIVGPSLMGKTQFAFSLARHFLVFYVNFASKEAAQSIYQAFDSISSVFISCLHEDVGILENRKIELDSDQIAEHFRTIKLKTIGFLWEFVKISTEFDSNASDWFEFYLKSRTIELKAMSLSDYLENLSNISYYYCIMILTYFLYRTTYFRFNQ
jgi:hypothetical protein